MYHRIKPIDFYLHHPVLGFPSQPKILLVVFGLGNASGLVCWFIQVLIMMVLTIKPPAKFWGILQGEGKGIERRGDRGTVWDDRRVE